MRTRDNRRFVAGGVALVWACASGCGREVASVPALPEPPSAPPAASTSVSAAPPKSVGPLREIADEEPLAEGRVVFEGMARPTKGGVSVRGVTLDEADVSRLLQANGRGDAEAHLGARLRVVAVLEKVESSPQKPGEPVMQMRVGTFFAPRAVEAITVVRAAEVLEGVLSRSKGMFAVGDRLVTSEDLGWSLRDAKTGDRVRLYGQPRTYVCPPDAQCLIGGSIPLFDIGRAERMR
ncbi:MAG: hypothetical protein IPK71_03505 [Myxococcales bacterium]|nr:hypothetical protein [Myxococcales bacterium]